MKKILKAFLGIIGVLYLVIILSVTVCLLCYNKYKVTEINGNSLIIIDNNKTVYKKGDLVFFKKIKNKDVKLGDEVFFYEVTNGISSINAGKITDIEKISKEETTFTINDNHDISSKSLIGRTESSIIYPKIGTILKILESKVGFLIFGILPITLLFLYEIYKIIIEIKKPLPQTEEETIDKLETTNNNNKVEFLSLEDNDKKQPEEETEEIEKEPKKDIIQDMEKEPEEEKTEEIEKEQKKDIIQDMEKELEEDKIEEIEKEPEENSVYEEQMRKLKEEFLKEEALKESSEKEYDEIDKKDTN